MIKLSIDGVINIIITIIVLYIIHLTVNYDTYYFPESMLISMDIIEDKI